MRLNAPGTKEDQSLTELHALAVVTKTDKPEAKAPLGNSCSIDEYSNWCKESVDKSLYDSSEEELTGAFGENK